MKPWLTAIVPIHEGARYLRSTLSAAAAERPEGVEFLLYDSSEESATCHRIAEEFSDVLNLRYVATPDCKPWTAKTNRGVREARGDYLAMLHQDDVWMPGHLRALQDAIKCAPHAVMSIAPSTFIDEDGMTVGRWRLPFASGLHFGTKIAETLIVQNSIAIPSPLVRQDAWQAVGGMDEDLWYTADWDLYLKLAGCGDIYVRPDMTTAFRIHRNSLTMTGSRRREDFSRQQELVVDRHLPCLPCKARINHEKLARASIAVNCFLADQAAGKSKDGFRAIALLFRLGPIGISRFLRSARLFDRVIPRLRLALKGALSS